jgi:Tol biopolymer transport system component
VFKFPVDGGEPVQLLGTLSRNPEWSPDRKFIVYSEQQGGGQFAVRAVTPKKSPVSVPAISVVYTRGTSYRFLPGQNALIALEGDFRRQNFFRVDLRTGEQRSVPICSQVIVYRILMFHRTASKSYSTACGTMQMSS